MLLVCTAHIILHMTSLRSLLHSHAQPDALKAVASVIGSKRSASSLSTSTSCAEEDSDTAGGCPLAREFNGVLKIVDTAADADADSSSSSDTVVVCNSSSGGGASLQQVTLQPAVIM
jgi:hypothetical protein